MTSLVQMSMDIYNVYELVFLLLTFLIAYIKIESIFSCTSSAKQSSCMSVCSGICLQHYESNALSIYGYRHYFIMYFYRIDEFGCFYFAIKKKTFQGLSKCRIIYKAKFVLIHHNLSTSEMICTVLYKAGSDSALKKWFQL
jgi:hypothetical protein